MKKPAEKPADVFVKCTVDNIWTSCGKMNRGGKLMLPADEADHIKELMHERNNPKTED